MLTEFKNTANDFLHSWGFYVCIGVVVVILICLIVFYFVYKNKTKNEDGFEKIKKEEIKIANNDKEIWINNLGGENNIVEISATKSRLTVKLNDVTNINKDELKKLGVSNIIAMSNKVTLVIEDKAEEVANILK